MRTASIILGAFALVLVACGGGSKKEPPAVADVLSAATTAAKGVSSFHFRLNHENGATPMPLNLLLVSAEGDVVVPDRMAADVKAKAASVTASVKVVAIGEQAWVTNPFSRRWQQLPPGSSIRDVIDPAALVTYLLGPLKNALIVGQAEVDSVRAYQLTARVDSGALKPVLPTAEAGHPVTVELWIGVADALPRRARISGKLSDGEPGNIVREVDLTRFNAKVDIWPPE